MITGDGGQGRDYLQPDSAIGTDISGPVLHQAPFKICQYIVIEKIIKIVDKFRLAVAVIGKTIEGRIKPGAVGVILQTAFAVNQLLDHAGQDAALAQP